MARILIADHDDRFLDVLRQTITRMGHAVTCVTTLPDVLEAAMADGPDVVLLNSGMADGKAIDVLPKILSMESFPEVIIMTESGDPDEAELAIKHGAWDYIEKPQTARGVSLSIIRVLQYRVRKPSGQSRVVLDTQGFKHLVGNSPRMKICVEHLLLAARGDANVLITGETGTGKELFAWAIHKHSSRADKRFVVVDCAALPETLVESTLFGYEKGAFTGAHKDQEGLIKRAHGGTLFLDEVGELPLAIQKSFLRVLHERRFRRVGGTVEAKSDFRLIVATHRDLGDMVNHRLFRKDLLYRLRAFTIELPPLCERTEDVEDLARYHMVELCRSYEMDQKGFSPEFFEVLAKYDWPGNVRELVNALERAITAARDEPVLFPKHLPTYIRVQLARTSVVERVPVGENINKVDDMSGRLPKLAKVRDTALAEVEQDYLRELIGLTGRDIPQACRLSGLSRSRLYALLKKYDISSSS
jgi:two-component system, NtrC family, response regulator